jgi:hypothetical protein
VSQTQKVVGEVKKYALRSDVFVSVNLQQAATLDPDFKGKIVDWTIQRAKAQSTFDKTTTPIALLQAFSQWQGQQSSALTTSVITQIRPMMFT